MIKWKPPYNKGKNTTQLRTTEDFAKDLKAEGISDEALNGANLETIFKIRSDEGIDATIAAAAQELKIYD